MCLFIVSTFNYHAKNETNLDLFLSVCRIAEGLHWNVNSDGGGEANAARRGLPDSCTTPIDKGGGEVAEEDPAENQEQGEWEDTLKRCCII